MMRTVIYLSAADMMPSASPRRSDAWELDLQWAALEPACRARGIALALRVWDAPGLIEEAAAADAVVIGTPWDYPQKVEAFLATLDALHAVVPVFNPPDIVRWNADKRYLMGLPVPTIPTRWVAKADAATIEASFQAFGVDRLVVKPVVGAGALRQALVTRGAPLPPPDALPWGEAMIQPYIPAVEGEGEVSLVAFGGQVSHALRKRPASGDYRVQAMYGGVEEVYVPDAAALDLARAALDAVPGGADRALIARVDLLPDGRGGWFLIELELIEPYLYPVQGPAMGLAFADALRARLP